MARFTPGSALCGVKKSFCFRAVEYIRRRKCHDYTAALVTQRQVADGVRRLSANVYKGSSPGYVPTAYPQIARALEDLANNIPEGLNLEVEK